MSPIQIACITDELLDQVCYGGTTYFIGESSQEISAFWFLFSKESQLYNQVDERMYADINFDTICLAVCFDV